MPIHKKNRVFATRPYFFCTLLAQTYVFRFLALHASLTKTTPSFRLWVLCMDQTTFAVLTCMRLPNVHLIALDEFEDAKLKHVKSKRTLGEYCWTCTSSLILYVLTHNPQIDIIGYLDADLFFFSSPAPIYREFANHSILLIPHRHSPEYAFLEKRHGTYNVGLLLFRNDTHAKAALTYWRHQCLKWCSVIATKNKYGDQAYLNEFPSRFHGVCISQHIGADVAPWNVSSYLLSQRSNHIYVDNTLLLFYHFASFQLYEDTFEPVSHNSFFRIPPKAVRFVYVPYVRTLNQCVKRIRTRIPSFHSGIQKNPQMPLAQRIRLAFIPLVYITNFYNIVYTWITYMRTGKTPLQITGVKRLRLKDIENKPFTFINKKHTFANNHRSKYLTAVRPDFFSGAAFASENIAIYCTSGSCVLTLTDCTISQSVAMYPGEYAYSIPHLTWLTVHHATRTCSLRYAGDKDLVLTAWFHSFSRFQSYIRTSNKP